MTFLERRATYARESISWFILAACLVPLLFISGLYYPFVVPKTLVFQGLGLLAVAAFSFAALSGESFYYARLRAWQAYIPAALLFLEYFASAFGVDFFHSFWGSFSRGDGLLTSTVAVGFGYLILLIADERFVGRLLKTISLVALVVALIGFIEWLEYIFHFSIALLPPATDRIGSTFGNAEFLASYLALASFLTLAYAFSLNAKNKIIWFSIAGFVMLVAVLTATRGTLAALFSAAVFALIVVALWGKRNAKRARGILLGVLLVALLGIVFRTELSHSSFKPVERIASISFVDSGTANRLYVWQNGFGEAFRHPLLGVGAEHETQLFDRFYDPTRIQEQWFDRLHNAFLDYFAEYGIAGVLLYLTLICAIFRTAYLRYRKSDDRFSFMLALGVLVYAVQNFFAFDNQSILFLLFVYFGIAYSLRDASVQTVGTPKRPVLGLIAALLFLIALVPVGVVPFQADRALASGYLYQIADVGKANSYFEKGYGYHTYANLEYGYVLHDLYIDTQVSQLTGAPRVAAYNSVVGILTKNFTRYSYDARTALYLAAVLDAAPPEVSLDSAQLKEAAARAALLSPKRAQATYLLVNASLTEAAKENGEAALASYADAVATLSAYTKNVPTLSEPHFVLASLYLALGENASAEQEAALGTSAYMPNVETAHRAVAYYLAAKNWQEAVKYLEQVTSLDPSDDASKLDLAKALYLSGNVQGARTIVNALKTSNSPYATSDPAFLSALGH